MVANLHQNQSFQNLTQMKSKHESKKFIGKITISTAAASTDKPTVKKIQTSTDISKMAFSATSMVTGIAHSWHGN